jgi:peptidoglycan/xylan/chitin deacetylase (PgdA/CDA1 family)
MKRLRRLLKAMPEAARNAQMTALRGALAAGTARATQTAGSRAANAAPLYLNWDETRSLLAQCITFGAHTHTHPILTRLSPAEAEAEIVTSKRILEAELKQPVRFFAYPNGGPGDFDDQTKALLRRHDFEAAVTLIRGGNPLRAGLDWLALRRVYIGGGDDRHTFIAKTSGVLDRRPFRSPSRTQPVY